MRNRWFSLGMARSPDEQGAAGGVSRAPLRSSIPELAAQLRSKAKILTICLSHSWGGLEQVAVNDVLEVAALGIPIRFLCLAGSPIHEALLHANAGPVLEIFTIEFRPREILDLRFRSEIERHVADGVNLVHTHQTSLLGSISPWLVKHPRVALVASRHIRSHHWRKGFFQRFVLSRVDAVVAISQALRQNILETHALPEKKVKVIHLGLDFERFDPERVDARRQREEWGAGPETQVVGMVGRIDPAKGQATFLRAAAGLLKGCPDGKCPFKFVIVGEETLGRTSTYLAELKDVVRQLRLEDHVVFAGYQENIPEVMSAFDIFVLPTLQETFGLVAIEAMAMECPILISKGGSAMEIVGEDELGVTVRPDDAYDLQNRLRWMLEHPEVCAEMGRKARRHVQTHYDRRLRIHRTLDLYDRMIRRRSMLV